MKAIILAAGFGSRLRPITDVKPKALVEINETPLLEITIKKLIFFGFKEIIINLCHFSEMIIDFLKKNNFFGVQIELSDESGNILDTGGAIKKAAWFLNGSYPFLVHNVDIISNLDLRQFYKSHEQIDSIASLAVRSRPTERYFLFNDNFELCGWKNKKTGEIKIARNKPTALREFAYSGIQVVSPKIFNLLPNDEKFSIVDFYLSICDKYNITGYDHSAGKWIDIGKHASLQEAQNLNFD